MLAALFAYFREAYPGRFIFGAGRFGDAGVRPSPVCPDAGQDNQQEEHGSDQKSFQMMIGYNLLHSLAAKPFLAVDERCAGHVVQQCLGGAALDVGCDALASVLVRGDAVSCCDIHLISHGEFPFALFILVHHSFLQLNGLALGLCASRGAQAGRRCVSLLCTGDQNGIAFGQYRQRKGGQAHDHYQKAAPVSVSAYRVCSSFFLLVLRSLSKTLFSDDRASSPSKRAHECLWSSHTTTTYGTPFASNIFRIFQSESIHFVVSISYADIKKAPPCDGAFCEFT